MCIKNTFRTFVVNKHIMTKLQSQVIELLKEGFTPSEVAKKLNRNKSTVSSVIKRFDIKCNKKYGDNINHNYFDIIDNETKSYLLGFFIADGWICDNRFGVTIQEEDNYILEYIKSFTGSNIYTKNRTTDNITRKNASTIRWTSEHMKNTYKNYNIVNNKTYNTLFEFPFENIPTHLIQHFVRGFIDGDGSFESHKGIFTVSIVNTSFNFLTQLGNILQTITEGIEYNIKKTEGKTLDYYVLRLSYNRENKPEKVMHLYNYLYQDSTIFLTRKKDKIESYLKYRGKLIDNTINHCNA